MKKKVAFLLSGAAAAFLLCSCFGAYADISIKTDGSGSITLEYRVSQMLESLGRLDGNERWPAIPVGRADFDRSLAGIPGLRLGSFSSKNTPNKKGGADLVTRVNLEFNDTGALVTFLDKSGTQTYFSRENGNKLHITLLDPGMAVSDADLSSLVRDISDGYEIGISLNAPKNAILSTVPTDIKAAKLVSQGKTVSFSIGLAELLALNEGLALEVTW